MTAAMRGDRAGSVRPGAEQIARDLGSGPAAPGTVGDVMTTGVVTVQPEAPVRAVIDQLIEHELSALPVVGGDGRPLGVVSATDILVKQQRRRTYRGGELPDRDAARRERLLVVGQTARELMSTPARTVAPETTWEAMLDELLAWRRLPVVDRDGRIVGVVSRRDALRGLLANRPEAR